MERAQNSGPNMAASEIGGGDRVFSVTDDVTRWRRAKLKGETGFPK
jgi:hypothetical protein